MTISGLPISPATPLASAARPRAAEKAARADTAVSAKDQRAATQKELAIKRVQQLREQMKAIKMLHASDPKGMTRALAQLARELMAAVKDYRDAGGRGGDAGGTLAETAAAANAPQTPADPYREQQQRSQATLREADAEGDVAFVRDTRDLVKSVKELLVASRRQIRRDSPEAKQGVQGARDIRTIEKMLDDLDRGSSGAILAGRLIKLDA